MSVQQIHTGSLTVAAARQIDLNVGRDLSVGRNLLLLGTGARIRGDFSNATHSNRALFQTATADSSTIVGVMPSGTAQAANLNLYAASNPDTAASWFQVGINQTGASLNVSGSTALPLAIAVGGAERMRIGTDGLVTLNGTAGLRANGTDVASTGALITENGFLFLGSAKTRYLRDEASTITARGGDFRCESALHAMNGVLYLGASGASGSYFSGATSGWVQLFGGNLHLNSGKVAILDGNTHFSVAGSMAGHPAGRKMLLTGAALTFPYELGKDKITLSEVDYSTPANPGIGVDASGNVGITNHQSWQWIFHRVNNYAGASGQRFNVNTGEVSVGPNGAPVGSNCLMSVHANYYGGIYYSTTSQFVGWPSQGAYKTAIEPVPSPLLALADPRLQGIRYQRLAHEWIEQEQVPLDPKDPLKERPYVYPNVEFGQPIADDVTYGFRVEDWQEAYPELCVMGPAGIKGFNLMGVVPITWQALREVYAELVTLRERVTALEQAAWLERAA